MDKSQTFDKNIVLNVALELHNFASNQGCDACPYIILAKSIEQIAIKDNPNQLINILFHLKDAISLIWRNKYGVMTSIYLKCNEQDRIETMKMLNIINSALVQLCENE